MIHTMQKFAHITNIFERTGNKEIAEETQTKMKKREDNLHIYFLITILLLLIWMLISLSLTHRPYLFFNN